MQSINIRHQLDIHWYKIIVSFLLLAMFSPAQAQNDPKENLLDYDMEWIHYGFLIGVHESKYRIQYADIYEDPFLDTLHSIVPGQLPGWKVGFVVDMYINDYLNFRILPTVGFYEYDLTYRYTDGTEFRELKPATTVELPMLLKLKSARRGNIGMYTVAGINPSFEAAGKGDQFDTEERLALNDFNMSVEAGLGFDLYFPLFKFSPEVRYAWGFRNMLTGNPNDFDIALKKLTYQNITVYITFEGGPSYIRQNKRNKRQKRG